MRWQPCKKFQLTSFPTSFFNSQFVKSHLMNGYNLTRGWYNYKFEHPDKVRAVHSDMYFYIVDLWNRLGQKKKFGLPTSITMELLNIKSKTTYHQTLRDLIKWGFITLVQKAINQNTSTIITLSAVSINSPALDTANVQQLDSKGYGTVPIDKQVTKKQRTNNKPPKKEAEDEKPNFIDQVLEVWKQKYLEKRGFVYEVTNKGKEHSAIGKIIRINRQKFPDLNSDQALENLGVLFEMCLNIDDNWLSDNMSPPILISKYNEIKTILTNGKSKNNRGKGATDVQIARIWAEALADK